MKVNCSLVNYDGDKIKKFTVTLINENGNTIDRTKAINGKAKLNLHGDPSEFGFRIPHTSTINYTLEYIVIMYKDTTITKRELVTITKSDLDNGHFNIVSTIGV